MIKEFLKKARERMKKVLEVVKEDLETIKVGRARPSLVEKIKVEAYEGTVLEIRELANITAPDPQQIIISPWDKTIIKKIGKVISDSDLKLSPIVEKELIRIKVPSLTEERRKEIGKLVEMKVESGRKMIRNVRNESKSETENLKKESGFSEDDVFKGLKELQKLHDEFIKKIEGLGEEKKLEIRN